MLIDLEMKEGNIINVTEGIIFCSCHIDGKMTHGLSAELRRMYPKAHRKLVTHEEKFGLELGDVVFHHHSKDLVIACAATYYYPSDNNRLLVVDPQRVGDSLVQVNSLAKEESKIVHLSKKSFDMFNNQWQYLRRAVYEHLDPDVKYIFWNKQENLIENSPTTT